MSLEVPTKEKGRVAATDLREWDADHLGFLARIVPEQIRLNRGLLEYTAFGEGPAVLALHGGLGGYDQGVILARTVGVPGYRYLAVSRPGYLGSSMGLGPGPEEEADTLVEFLDALGVTDVLVLAISGGGPPAIHFGLRHPERCRGLVLCSTVSGPGDARIPLSFRATQLLARIPFFARRVQARVEKDLDEAAGRGIPDEELRRRTLLDPHAGPLLRALVRSTVDRMDRRISATGRDIRVTMTREYPLESLTVPVLAVHGTRDTAASFRQAEALVRRRPETEIILLEGGGHDAIFTHRAQIRPGVAAFMDRTGRSRQGLAPDGGQTSRSSVV